MRRRAKLFGVICLMVLGAATFGVVASNVGALSYKTYQRIDFTFNPTLKLSVSGDLTIANLSLGTNSDSNIISVETGTNVPTGMLLTATVGSSNSPYNTTSLVNGSNSFAALTGSAASLDGSDFGVNKWGYSYCVGNCSTNSGVWRSGDIDSASVTTGYAGLPLYNDADPLKLVNTSDITDETLQFKIGAKASGAQASGEYTNVINFVAVTNVVATEYTLAYIDESNQASGMPTSITNPVAVSGPVAISASMPSRLSYIFEGWCTMQLSNGNCPGNVYQPGESYPVSEFGGTVAINLYAIWKSKCDGVTSLYGLVACRSRGVQVANDLKTSISVSNSGVYEYNSSVFGVSSDASNDYPIYYYRGILDNSFASSDNDGNIGSSGDGTLHPNYVILDADGTRTTTDTCWRIVRTTGSGGVKMIYNGKWTGFTCANNATAAQVATSTFNSLYNSAVYVGYTYNSNKASSTDIETIDDTFGSNRHPEYNNARSDIKVYIEDAWYVADNMTTYTGILEPNAGYCSDRTVYDTSGNLLSGIVPKQSAQVSFGPHNRNFVNGSDGPTLRCPRGEVDIYRYVADSTGLSNELKVPAAPLTADESALAGSGRFSGNPTTYSGSSYLRSGSGFWLLSPGDRYSNGSVRGFGLYSSGPLVTGGVSSSAGVRPAISLSHGTNISSGSGTAADPWVIDAPSN